MKNLFGHCLLLIAVLSLNKVQSQSANQYQIIYEANAKGEIVKGNLDSLIQYVQNGNPVRVGWVLKFNNPDPNTDEVIEMQHWTDAGFVTTLKGHVFAQISSIYQQGPGISDPPSVFLVNDKPDGWVAIIGTTGVMRQKYTMDEEMITQMKESMKKGGFNDEQIEKEIKSLEAQNVITKWAVLKN